MRDCLSIDAKTNIKHVEDFQNHKVSCEKAKNILGFKPRFHVEDIVTRISQVAGDKWTPF